MNDCAIRLNVRPHRKWLKRLILGVALLASTTFSDALPAEAAPSDDLTVLTIEFNDALDKALDSVSESLPDSQIALFDVNTLFAQTLPLVLAETVQSCVQGPSLAPASEPTSICVNPNEHLFFDEIHPTANVHSIMGEMIKDVIAQDISAEVTELMIFGDSLSDRGNVFSFSGGMFPFPVAIQGPLIGSPLYADGSFSNGSLWWQTIVEEQGLSEPIAYYEENLAGNLPTLSDGSINFAVGGATTGTDNAGNAQTPPFPVALPGLQDQIAAFEALALAEGGANPDALYVIWAGPNNFLGSFIPVDPANPFGPFTDFTTDATEPAADIAIAIEALYDLGARNFLVGNMYDLGNTPLARDFDIVFP